MLKKVIFFLLLFISAGAIVNLKSFSMPFYPLILFIAVMGIATSPKVRIPLSASFITAFLIIIFSIEFISRNEAITDGDNLEILIKYVIVWVLSIYCSSAFKDKRDFLAQFVAFFEKLLVFSYFTFVASNVLNAALLNFGGKTAIGDQYQTFFGMCYTTAYDYLKYGFHRNQSIFWEPGVYGMVILVMYMVKTIYLQDKKKLWKYYAALFTTFSMGSVAILCIFIVFSNLLSKGKYVFNARLVIFSILITSPIIFVINFINTYSGLIEQFIGTLFHRNLSQDTSIDTRTTDLVYGFQASLDDLYVGHGQNYADFYALTSYELNTSKAEYGGGITNGIIGLLYCYGLVYILIFFYLLYRASRDISYFPKYTLLIFFTFIGVLMVEPLQFSLFIMLLMTFYNDRRLLKFN
jgi:hypothetical protein